MSATQRALMVLLNKHRKASGSTVALAPVTVASMALTPSSSGNTLSTGRTYGISGSSGASGITGNSGSSGFGIDPERYRRELLRKQTNKERRAKLDRLNKISQKRKVSW